MAGGLKVQRITCNANTKARERVEEKRNAFNLSLIFLSVSNSLAPISSTFSSHVNIHNRIIQLIPTLTLIPPYFPHICLNILLKEVLYKVSIELDFLGIAAQYHI